MKPRNTKKDYLLQQGRRLFPGVSPEKIQLRVLDLFRADLFKGLLADAILHRLQPPLNLRAEGPPALIAILLSRFSSKAVELARDYVAAFCPDLDWLVLDIKGRASYSWRGQIHEQRVDPFQRSAPYEVTGSAPSRLFSPNNQWLLKVVLLAGMDARYWGGPELPAFSRVSDLARRAGKPQPSVSAFLQLAEGQGWLTRENDGFTGHRIPQLLEQWSYHLRGTPDRVVPVASLYPGEGVDDVLRRLRGNTDAVVGGHFGAHALGLGISNVKTPRIYVRDLDAGLETFALAAVPADRAIAVLAQPGAPDAVFKGAVTAGQEVPVADILQTYFDVRLSLARGEEQANHIYEQVLAPFFRKQQWL